MLTEGEVNIMHEKALRGDLRPNKKVSDGNGLLLRGGRHWKLAYLQEGVQKEYTIGTYPAVSLETARKLAAEAREQIVQGNFPQEGTMTTDEAFNRLVSYCKPKKPSAKSEKLTKLFLSLHSALSLVRLYDNGTAWGSIRGMTVGELTNSLSEIFEEKEVEEEDSSIEEEKKI